MIVKPIQVLVQNVPGTCRQIVVSSNGSVLQRQNIYMKEKAWDALRELATNNRMSGSAMIAKLIWQETWRNNQSRKVQQ